MWCLHQVSINVAIYKMCQQYGGLRHVSIDGKI